MKRQGWAQRYHEHHHHHHHDRFSQYHRHHLYFRYGRPIFLAITLVILYLLFYFVSLQGWGVFFAGLIGLIAVKEIIQFVFLMRIEKRVFQPIEKLLEGVDAIAQGNYQVQIENNHHSDLSMLIDAFNKMAQNLLKDEKLKADYEENRKLLIANISHDLKTPITTIQGYIEALLDETMRQKINQEAYLQKIHKNTVYTNKLIDDLFLFSKLDMQKLEFQFEIVEMGPFMADLMEEYQFECNEHQVQFQYSANIAPNCYVRLDRRRFHQVVTNIIHNAMQYGPEKGLAIMVSAESAAEKFCLAIEDNGPGISNEQLPFIFERFYRVDAERSKNLGSTGLGLAIAKELIEAHGGEIIVKSVLGQGTCFQISLPSIAIREGEGVYEADFNH